MSIWRANSSSREKSSTATARLAAAALFVVLVASTAARAADNYTVQFDGAPKGFEKTLELISNLAIARRDYPTSAAIRLAAKEDVTLITNALKAAGYYQPRVGFTLARPNASEKIIVTFQIEPGPEFKITDYRIVYADVIEGERPASLQEVKIPAQKSAAGASLQQIQQQFLAALWDDGFPAAKITARRAEAEADAGTAVAVFVFESGPKAVFGGAEITGAERTQEDFLIDLKTWNEGDVFERSKLVTYRDRLAETGLFGSIDVAPGTAGDDGAAPVLVTIEERKRRTVGAGVSYSTAEGPGGRLFLEYRNMLGRGEKARVAIEGTQIKQAINFSLTKPMPTFPGALFGNFSFINETTDAFDARSVALAFGASKKWLDDRLETRGGVALETSNVKTGDSEERTYFVSTPLSVIWNTENDLLDPTRGVKASLAVTPYTGTDSFTRAEINARSRLTFGNNNRFILAGRTRLGATFGSTLSDLPVNKRFFAGGGASIRGYDFQAAGPLDADDNPIGGRSVLEGALEGRVRVAKNLQLAAFVDAGAVYPQALPDFAGDYFIGAGGGIRYLTPVGPIRIDAAIPLDKRESDRSFQLYISLGQPF